MWCFTFNISKTTHECFSCLVPLKSDKAFTLRSILAHAGNMCCSPVSRTFQVHLQGKGKRCYNVEMLRVESFYSKESQRLAKRETTKEALAHVKGCKQVEKMYTQSVSSHQNSGVGGAPPISHSRRRVIFWLARCSKNIKVTFLALQSAAASNITRWY